MAAINLTNRDYRRISEIVRLTRDVQVVKRAQALLWLSEGDTPEEVAERLWMTP
jgi:DNA-binding CsgD family transcriptional regulator